MKYGHFGPFSLEYLLWDDTGEEFAMKFVHLLLLGDGDWNPCFFFFCIIIYVEWIMDSVGLLFLFNVGLLFVCIMDIELRK